MVTGSELVPASSWFGVLTHVRGPVVVATRQPVDLHRALLPLPSVCTVTLAGIEAPEVTVTVVPR